MPMRKSPRTVRRAGGSGQTEDAKGSAAAKENSKNALNMRPHHSFKTSQAARTAGSSAHAAFKASVQQKGKRKVEAEPEHPVRATRRQRQPAPADPQPSQKQLARTEARDAAGARVAEQGLALAKQQEEIGQLKEELKTGKDEIGQLKGQLAVSQGDMGQLKEQLKASQDDNEALTRDVEQLQAARLRVEQELLQERTEVARVSAQAQEQRAEIDRLAAALAAAEAETARERGRAETAELSLEQRVVEVGELVRRISAQEELRRQMHETIQTLRGNIRVFCRIRGATDAGAGVGPLLRCAADGRESTVLELQPPRAEGAPPMSAAERERVQRFQFDHVFNGGVSQADVFYQVEPLVQSALDGHNVCIFAYGQTGSGKTFTMEGPSVADATMQGIIPRSVGLLFARAAELSRTGWAFAFETSCLEIYNEELHDLLAGGGGSSGAGAGGNGGGFGFGGGGGGGAHKLKLIDVGGAVCVPGLSSVSVSSIAQINELLITAARGRSTAATKCNERSSRSHYVFRLRIRGSNADAKTSVESELNLIDLAGSERIKESGVADQQLVEAKSINKSLSSLGDVVCALGTSAKHVPFRNSKLTHFLQNSLNGSSKCLMFVNVSSMSKHFQETLSSLRFAQKVSGCLPARRGSKA